MKIKECHKCITKTLVPTNQKGKKFHWKGDKEVILVYKFILFNCICCGNTPMTGKENRQLNRLLEKSYLRLQRIEKLNDFLVRLRLKQRLGKITEMEYVNTSYVCVPNISKTSNHICVQGNVKKIEYVYNWLWPPFQKVKSAKKRKVPFEKHTNPACQKEIDLKNTV